MSVEEPYMTVEGKEHKGTLLVDLIGLWKPRTISAPQWVWTHRIQSGARNATVAARDYK